MITSLKKSKSITLLATAIIVLIFTQCKVQNNSTQAQSIIDKTTKSTIYEVNIRQYTPEGTFKAFEKHIPQLKDMGIDILWLMPIYPIGEKNRKGTLGSYYSVKNYTKINPNFGNSSDLQHLINTAHSNNMLVILDWVANHTAWDNPWITEHPDWYTHNSNGKIIPPVKDWTDVADLNYDNADMRKEMTNALKYWIINYKIDGYRCDVAGMVPTSFWDSAKAELTKIKPVFMLAEAEKTELQKHAFIANYAWELHHIMNQIAQNKENATSLTKYFNNSRFSDSTYRMTFTSNHDENSWNGTVLERMPNNYKTFAALSFVVPGFPLIYSGQEVTLNKRLRFFDKDTINWNNTSLRPLYKKLINLKKENNSLWNGVNGGKMAIIKTNNPTEIFAFTRTKDKNTVIAIFNLSDSTTNVELQQKQISYSNIFTNNKILLNKPIELKPWEYIIGVSNK